MRPSIKFYWDICLFKEKTENAPYSPLLLFMAIFLSFALSYLVIMRIDLYAPIFNLLLITPLGRVLLATLLLSPLVTIIYTLALLQACNFKERIVQTLTCLLMSLNIMYALLFALFFFAQILVRLALGGQQGLIAIGIIFGAVFILGFICLWLIALVRKIYKEALGLRIDVFWVVLGWVFLAVLTPWTIQQFFS